ncbi:MAG: carbon-nitrogen family hydrolase [Chloroflexota bacterium]
MQLTVSLAQIDIALGDPDSNCAKVIDWIQEAARRGSDLIILPELWSTGYDLGRAEILASAMNDGVVQQISEVAAAQKIWVLGSTLVSTDNKNAPLNRAILFDQVGETIATYDKIHLFGLMDEDQYLSPGQSLSLTETPWGKAGLAICYDLRFPEIFRSYALAGASMIMLPTEWPYPRQAHWQTLLRSRAIENQLYVMACNRVGKDRNNTFCGRSAIIDPWGEVVVEAGDTETLLTTTIDLDAVQDIRQKIPIFDDRRPDLYQIES